MRSKNFKVSPEMSDATHTMIEEEAGSLPVKCAEKAAQQRMDETDVKYDIKSFEDVLNIIGIFGKWNLTVFFLCYINTFFKALNAMSYQFLGATPDYWCRVDELIEANWTQQQVLDFAIPTKDDGLPERCQMYDYNYSLAADLGYEASMKNRDLIARGNGDDFITCYSRDFNFTQYESTVVTEYDLVCDRRALYSTTQAVTQFGTMISAILAGYLNDTFGRRRVAVLGVVLSLIASVGCVMPPTLEVYLLARTLVSIFSYLTYTSCFVLMVELCSPSQRSSVGSLYLIPWALGYIMMPGLAYVIRPWRWLQGAYTLPNVLLLVYFWYLPESPRWLITKGRYEEAVKVLSWAAKVNRRPLPPSDTLIEAMKKMPKTENVMADNGSSNSLWEKIQRIFVLLTTREFRKRTLICYFGWFSVSIIYYGVSLSSTNLSADPYIFMFLGGIVELPAYILLWPCLAYLGRKVSLVSQFLVCGVCIALIAILMVTVENVPVWILMFLSLTGKLVITATFHLLYIYTAELFPTKYRPLAVGQNSVMARVGSIAAPYILDILGASVSWGPSVLFSGVAVIAAGLAFMLPETKDAVLNEDKSFAKAKKISENHTNNGAQQNGTYVDSGPC